MSASHEPILTDDGRRLTLLTMGQAIPDYVEPGFVLLVPAYSSEECARVLARMHDILRKGCTELCAVGPLADSLHDAVDDFRVAVDSDSDRMDITVGITCEEEACVYFAECMEAGQAVDLVAMVSDHPPVEAILRQMLGCEGGA